MPRVKKGVGAKTGARGGAEASTFAEKSPNKMNSTILTLNEAEASALKTALSVVAGAIAAFCRPLVAPAAVCTAMVVLDFITAVKLGRRLKRAGCDADGRLSSRRFGRVVLTLVKIYGALAVAAMAQQWIICGYGGFDAVRFLAGAVCLWQLLSILENESTCSDARWARIARKFLVDKAKRYLGGES